MSIYNTHTYIYKLVDCNAQKFKACFDGCCSRCGQNDGVLSAPSLYVRLQGQRSVINRKYSWSDDTKGRCDRDLRAMAIVRKAELRGLIGSIMTLILFINTQFI